MPPQAIGLAVAELLFVAGAPLFVVNLAIAVTPLLLNAALSIGLSLLASAITQRQIPLPTPSDGQQELRQPLAPRTRSYGRVRVAGPVWWYAALGRVLYKGLAVNHGRIYRFVGYHIDENQVDLNGSDQVTSAPYASQNVFVHSRVGLPVETKYSELLTGFGIDNMRGDGVATVLATFENPTSVTTFQNTYPSGEPEVRVTIEASMVYDPRDAAQSRDNVSTWTWSDNSIKCLADYVTHSDGYGIPWDDVYRNLDQWIECMDVCEEQVALLGGGYSDKYRVAGTYRLTDSPRDVVAKFESTCDGRVWVKRDGSIGVSVGKFPTNVSDLVHVTDSHISGYTLSSGQDPVRSVQGIRAEYMSPDHDYREHEAEPWPTGAAVLALDDEDRTTVLDLLWVPSGSQARRLMKRTMARVTAKWHGTVHMDAFGFELLDERYCRLTIPELNIVDGTFEIQRWSGDPQELRTEMDVISVDATIDAWDPSEEGTQEGLTLTYVGEFGKVGTTIDPIAEAGAVIGEYVVIACANSTSTPATITGYDTLGRQNAGTPFAAVYGRKIDGTEGAVAVNGASGVIVVTRLQGVGDNPTVANLVVRRDDQTNDTWAAPATPFVVFSVFATNVDTTNLDLITIYADGVKTEIADHSVIQRDPGVSNMALIVESVLYRSDEQAPVNLSSFDTDFGNDMRITFSFLPGT